MLKGLFCMVVMLVTFALAEDSYSDYDSSYVEEHHPSYEQRAYRPPHGNNFYAPPPGAYQTCWNCGLDWGVIRTTGFLIFLVLLYAGGLMLAYDVIATYYYDFDTSVVIRSLGGLPLPEVSGVIASIERLQMLYEEATKKKTA